MPRSYRSYLLRLRCSPIGTWLRACKTPGQNSFCGAKGTRTPDPLLAKQVLFQLSYSPAARLSKGIRDPRVSAAGAGT